MSHVLFLMGGLLVGYGASDLLGSDDPNVTGSGALFVIAICLFIVAQQTATRQSGATPEE